MWIITSYLERSVLPKLSTLISYFSFYFPLFKKINLLFYFTILYWFCQTLTWILHGCTCVPYPELVKSYIWLPNWCIKGHIRQTLWLSLPCQGWGLLLSCWSRGPQICFLALFWSVVWGRWDWRTPTGREATQYSTSGDVHLWPCSAVLPFPCRVGSQITHLTGTSLGHILTLGLLAVGPGVSQALFSPVYWGRSSVFFNTSWIFVFFNLLTLYPALPILLFKHLYKLLMIAICNLVLTVTKIKQLFLTIQKARTFFLINMTYLISVFWS